MSHCVLGRIAWAALLAAFLLTRPVLAQSVPCAPRAVVLKSLHERYGEIPVNRGLSTNGSMVEVTANDKGGWTMLFTRPEGVSCMVLTGEAWQAVVPVPPADSEVRQ